jgi:PPOX class probable F420-dependent enzyme
MTTQEARARLAAARVARLATTRPRIVPIVFALHGDTLVHAVDHKPKRTRALARLDDVRADPRVSVLADEYDDTDWSRLWWVRADGTARILHPGGADEQAAIDLLVARYAPYRERRPEGPVLAIDVTRWSGWSAAE